MENAIGWDDGNPIEKNNKVVDFVKIPHHVFNLWVPLLGVKVVGVYISYCWLARDGQINGWSQARLAKALRIGKDTLSHINKTLEECGFIEVVQPRGPERIMHMSARIRLIDPPREVSREIISKFGAPSRFLFLQPSGVQT